MNNLPGGAELLKIARKTLLENVLSSNGDTRYNVLMIANAMAIAAREAEAGVAPMADAEERELARAIRAGEFDAAGGEQRKMLARLREAVLHRLSISNPKLIERLAIASSGSSSQ